MAPNIRLERTGSSKHRFARTPPYPSFFENHLYWFYSLGGTNLMTVFADDFVKVGGESRCKPRELRQELFARHKNRVRSHRNSIHPSRRWRLR